MIEKLIAAINPRLPLTILRAEWCDPVLSLIGADWTFNTTSSWRLIDGSKLVAGSEDQLASEAVSALAGVEMVRCEPMSVSPLLDPRFLFGNGLKLEVFSATATEPWVLSLKGGPTFVASPS